LAFHKVENILGQLIRVAVAGNPATPAETLGRLARDEDRFLRSAVVGNPSTPSEVLAWLSGARAKGVSSAPAEDCSATYDVLMSISLESGRAKLKPQRRPIKGDLNKLDVWHHLAKLAPDELNRMISLEGLPPAKRQAMRKRLATKFIGKHGRATRPSLQRLACLLLPDCPTAVLAKAGRSSDWKERLAIACHPKTPPAIRQRLANDGNRFVRAAAQQAIEEISE
jgi:hypothetical protein